MAGAIDVQDSDKVISLPEGGHIYGLFLSYTLGANRRPSLNEIEKRERAFLQTAGPASKPLLLAAGPFLPSRQPEWSQFIHRVKPVRFYLQKSAEEVLKGLLQRRARHLQCPKLANKMRFGCWDQDVTTEYKNGRWVALDPRRALKNVRRHMRVMVNYYKLYATQTFTWRERQNQKGKDRLNSEIRQGLGV